VSDADAELAVLAENTEAFEEAGEAIDACRIAGKEHGWWKLSSAAGQVGWTAS
jgi:hypothetical protein